METLYTARATATGAGRMGHVRSDDGVLEHDLGVPKELGGAGTAGTNPEQLFAAGYAACFHSALQRIGAQGEGQHPWLAGDRRGRHRARG